MEETTRDRDHHQLFGVRRSVRYHVHRRRFFEFLTTATTTISFFGATAAGITHANVTDPTWLPIFFAGIVALVNALSLSIGTSRLASIHSDLARRFVDLESRFDPTEPLTDEEYKNRVKERLAIEATVPPTKRLLDVLCHFELMRAMGYPDEPPKIPWRRRVMAHVFSQATYAISIRDEQMDTP